MSKNHAQEVRTLLHKNRVLTLEAEGLRETTKRVQSQLKVSTQPHTRLMPRPEFTAAFI